MAVSTVTTINLLTKLQAVPDMRRREGRRYPLASVLGMLILAALNGESSLRGMLGWGDRHWQVLARPLGFKVGTSAPVYGTVWRILHLLPQSALEDVLGAWLATDAVENEAAVAVDGKQLRGSKRRESSLPALHVVTAAAQGIGVVLGEDLAALQDDVAATLALLERLPIQGKVVTLDAGLLTREVAQTILEKGGAYLSGLAQGKSRRSDVCHRVLVGSATGASPARLCRNYQTARAGRKTRVLVDSQCGAGSLPGPRIWLGRRPTVWAGAPATSAIESGGVDGQ